MITKKVVSKLREKDGISMNVMELARFLNGGDVQNAKCRVTGINRQDVKIAACEGDGRVGPAVPSVTSPGTKNVSELSQLGDKIHELEEKFHQCEIDARKCKNTSKRSRLATIWVKLGNNQIAPANPDELRSTNDVLADLKSEMEKFEKLKASVMETLQQKEFEQVMLRQAKSPFRYRFGDNINDKTGSKPPVMLTKVLHIKRNSDPRLYMSRADLVAYETINQYFAHKQEYIKLVMTAYKKEANRLERGLVESQCSAYIPDEYSTSEQRMDFMKRMMPLLKANLKDLKKRQLAIRKEQQEQMKQKRKSKLEARNKRLMVDVVVLKNQIDGVNFQRIDQCPGMMNPPMRLWTIVEEDEAENGSTRMPSEPKDIVLAPKMGRKSRTELFSPRPSPRLPRDKHSSGDAAAMKEEGYLKNLKKPRVSYRKSFPPMKSM